MHLKMLDSSSSPSAGYGAGSGEIIREEYECPCGEGKVVYEKDDIPGFKDSSTSCYCPNCTSKYNFSRGTAVEI
ncbi:hypothetical protein [Cytobacillus horneckiae]|uniref:hypothetical protein n=1 Tax=Cytobacillus horneckiae TaxID=549687 RepID=UPI00203AAF22|nr:hypothetical protein [Cytobacillus horneckiae]MCM3180230.1 hypothetical protein [Cytobacillus horneckiae]